MNFSQTCTIGASREQVWDFLMDMENVSGCMPGVEQLERIDDETYQGTLKIKVGPISVKFHGQLSFESRDREQWRARMRAEAKDRRLGGGVRARLEVDLAEEEGDRTLMTVHLESHVLGKIGEFGQSMMRKKTGAILEEFAQRVGRRLTKERA